MTKIGKAVSFAVEAHGDAKRKGKERLYILHPIEAMTIAAGLTEDEDVLAAAVLHDVVEDTDTGEEEIRERFGDRVADLVMAESEDKMRDVPAELSWRARKEAAIEHLKTASRDVKLICLGDKLSNIREMERDCAALGDALWERFNQKDKGQHAWYYGAIYAVLREEFGDVPAICEYRALLERVFGRREDIARHDG